MTRSDSLAALPDPAPGELLRAGPNPVEVPSGEPVEVPQPEPEVIDPGIGIPTGPSPPPSHPGTPGAPTSPGIA